MTSIRREILVAIMIWLPFAIFYFCSLDIGKALVVNASLFAVIVLAREIR